MIKANNILLVRTDRMGELLLTTPAIRAVHDHFPKAKITVVVNPPCAEIVEGNPFIDSVVTFDPKQIRGLFVRLKFLSFLKNSKFDLAVMFNPSKFFNILTFFAGIPARAGYDRKLGFLLTHKIKDRKHLCEKPEIEYNLELIETIGIKGPVKAPDFVIDGASQERIDRILETAGFKGSFVAVHPATSNSEKLWPQERFAQLSDKLIDECKIRIIFIGGKEEKILIGGVRSAMRNPALDLSGKLTLKELGALFRRCVFLISNDSGPAHLAAAVGTPVVVFFGENRPGGSSRRWGPYGEGHIVIERPKVTDITVDEAYRSISDRFLKNAGKL